MTCTPSHGLAQAKIAYNTARRMLADEAANDYAESCNVIDMLADDGGKARTEAERMRLRAAFIAGFLFAEGK